MRIPEKFTNLKVLPRKIPRKQLIVVMKGFSKQLGVRCSYCHQFNPETHKPDFASDAKPEKRAARVMMRMTSAIDKKYLTQVPAPLTGKAKVTCYTCHRGQSVPDDKQLAASVPMRPNPR